MSELSKVSHRNHCRSDPVRVQSTRGTSPEFGAPPVGFQYRVFIAFRRAQLTNKTPAWLLLKRCNARGAKKLFTLLDLCVSSLRRGHANLLCIVPILTDDPRRESDIFTRDAKTCAGPTGIAFCFSVVIGDFKLPVSSGYN